MYRVCHITAFDRPELQPYQTMRRQMDHRRQGIFVAEGEKVVRRLLTSSFTVVSAVLPQRWFEALEPDLRDRPETIDVFIAGKKLLETLTGFSMYQGLLAVGKVPPPPDLETLLARAQPPRLLAAVDSLSSAENLGALVRNCAGFNVHALLVGESCTSPYLRRAVRSSMGTVFGLPIIETAHLAATLQQLRRRGVRCVAAHPHVEDHTLTSVDLSRDSCLVFGSEGYGISPEVLAACDDSVAIRMPVTVDSLNVASAAAVFLYEASRQRGRM